LISILAWITIQQLVSKIETQTIVRTMPSMLMQVGKGSTWRVQQWNSDATDFMKDVFAHAWAVYTYEKESQLNDLLRCLVQDLRIFLWWWNCLLRLLSPLIYDFQKRKLLTEFMICSYELQHTCKHNIFERKNSWSVSCQSDERLKHFENVYKKTDEKNC
jgi:hypothetical protein